VTYFAAGTTKGTIAFATGQSQAVTQMVVDSHGNVWSTHDPNPTVVYFKDKKTCIPDPSGSIKRFEGAEEFSKGTLVRHLYSSTSDSPVFAGGGLSVAVDSSGRIYIGTQNTSDEGVLIDYDSSQSCPNDSLSFVLPTRAFPQVAVDNQRRLYVTDYNDNSISAYEGGSKKLLKRITQEKGVIDISSTAINP
jgi:sugar lactone lactonase YvrE